MQGPQHKLQTWVERISNDRYLKIKALCLRITSTAAKVSEKASRSPPTTTNSGNALPASKEQARTAQAVLGKLMSKAKPRLNFSRGSSNRNLKVPDQPQLSSDAICFNDDSKLEKDSEKKTSGHGGERNAHIDRMDEEQETQFVHPVTLFSDESRVLEQFGMGCTLSPNVPGFSAIFRQRWQDFYVTEMDHVAEPLTRSRDYSTPPIPSWLVHGMPGDVQGVEDKTRDADEYNDAAPVTSSFFTVNVEEQLKSNSWLSDCGAEENPNGATHDVSAGCKNAQTPFNVVGKSSARSTEFFLQATLHKQHVAHPVAMNLLSKTLRVSPHAISFAGIKDFIGDTVQRVRLRNVSPGSAIDANKVWHKHGTQMTLSNFSYESSALRPGQLFGNHFRIILRDVVAPKVDVDKAMKAFAERGFPNYYGCQRFSWFGGTNDAAFAILSRNWLAFAFRFLNYTDQPMTLRQLLQRELKFPHAIQDHFRKRLVIRLRKLNILPMDLDAPPFLDAPNLFDSDLSQYDGSIRIRLALRAIEEAFFDLASDGRRMVAQRLSSYLWNQVLSLRLHHFDGQQVLIGDLVVPKEHHKLSRELAQENLAAATTEAKRRMLPGQLSSASAVVIVTPENIDQFTIEDVVHPGFSFDGRRLPMNHVADFYHDVCEKYHLDWDYKLSKQGINDFFEPPRPIVRKPIGFTYKYVSDEVIEMEFALEKGCYANVAVTELLKLSRCSGHETVTMLPLPASRWNIGRKEPTYVSTMQDIYEGFEDGLGFVNDTTEPARPEEISIFDYDGPLFKSPRDDPFAKAARWSAHNLVKAVRRRELDAKASARQLLEPALANQLLEGEIDQYAGHTVPMSPNTKRKRMFFKVLSRKRRFQGCPKFVPRMQLGADVQNRNRKVPFSSLNKKAWNFVL